MATVSIDTSAILDIANRLRALDDPTIANSTENLSRIARGLDSFQALNVYKLSGNLTKLNGITNIVSTLTRSIGTINPRSSFFRFGNQIGKSIEGISKGLDAFSKISLTKVKRNLDFLKTELTEIVKDFSDAFSGTVSSDFKKLGEDFGRSLGEISQGLSKFSELSVLKIKKNLDKLLDRTDPHSIIGIIGKFNSAFNEKSTDIFVELGDTFGESLSRISEGLSNFSELSIVKVKRNIEKIQSELSGIVDIFTTSFSGTVTEEFKILGEDFGRSLGEISNGLKSFGEISIFQIERNLINLRQTLPNIIRDFRKRFKGEIGDEFKLLGDDLGRPLAEISKALKDFSELSIISLKKNILLFQFLPGSLKKLAKKLSDVGPDLEKAALTFGVPLAQIAAGLKGITELDIIDLKKNILLLQFFPGSLKKLAEKLSDVGPDLEKAGETFGKPLQVISKGLTDFGNIEWLKVTVSIVGMKLFTKLLVSALKGLSEMETYVVKAANAVNRGLIPLMGSLEAFSARLGDIFKKALISVGEAVAGLFGVLGDNLGRIAKGSLAIGLISASLLLASTAFKSFSDVNWKGVLIGAGALTVLTAAMFGLGALVSGPQGLIFLAGMAALTGLGVSLIPAAFAFKLLGEGADGVAKALSQIAPQLSELAGIGPGLLTTATALGVLSAALLAFSTSSMFSSGAGLFGKLFGVNPVDKLKELALLGDGLEKTATSLERINAARSSSGQDLEGTKYDTANKKTAMNIEKQAGANLVDGGSSSVTNVGGSTINNTSVNQTNIMDRTSFVLSPNMRWAAYS